MPVETLSTAIRPLGEFPYHLEENEAIRQFNGRVLFLRALQSGFIPESALPLINSFFPSSEIVDIDCGHWIVQEKPEEFRKSEFPTPSCIILDRTDMIRFDGSCWEISPSTGKLIWSAYDL